MYKSLPHVPSVQLVFLAGRYVKFGVKIDHYLAYKFRT